MRIVIHSDEYEKVRVLTGHRIDADAEQFMKDNYHIVNI